MLADAKRRKFDAVVEGIDATTPAGRLVWRAWIDWGAI